MPRFFHLHATLHACPSPLVRFIFFSSCCRIETTFSKGGIENECARILFPATPRAASATEDVHCSAELTHKARSCTKLCAAQNPKAITSQRQGKAHVGLFNERNCDLHVEATEFVCLPGVVGVCACYNAWVKRQHGSLFSNRLMCPLKVCTCHLNWKEQSVQTKKFPKADEYPGVIALHFLSRDVVRWALWVHC